MRQSSGLQIGGDTIEGEGRPGENLPVRIGMTPLTRWMPRFVQCPSRHRAPYPGPGEGTAAIWEERRPGPGAITARSVTAWG